MKKIFFLFLVIFLFSACKNYQNFIIEEPIIAELSLTGNNKLSEGEIRSNINALNTSYQRLFSPKFYLYLANKRKIKDSLNKKINLRFFDTPNPKYDSTFVKSIKESLVQYYQENGFLQSKVDYKVDSSSFPFFRIKFIINEGSPSLFNKNDSIAVNNPAVSNFLTEYLKTESIIKKNKYLNLQQIQLEKKNLVLFLKNQGYYKFSDDAISIQINDLKDTTLKNIDLVYQIPRNNFQGSLLYDRQFRFDRPNFQLYNQRAEPIPVSALLENKLRRLVKIQFGDNFSQNKINQAVQNLNLSDQFRSTNLNLTETNTLLKPHFELFLQDKYNLSSELGGSVFRGIPGPFISNSFKIRRFFSYLDYLDISARIGLEAQAGFINTETARKNLDIALQASINIPYLTLPNSILQAKLFSNTFASRTQYGIGYNYINRPEYARNNANIFYNFYFQKSNRRFYKLSLFDLNLINTSYPNTIISFQFQDYLEKLKLSGNNLYRSFNPSFVSNINFSFQKVNFDATNKLVDGKSISYSVESGGTLLNFVPGKSYSFIESFFGNSSKIQFYRYLRFDLDFRRYILLGLRDKTQLAFKLKTGMAYSYSPENGYQLPYEKNFFIGGPSSIRAWRPRRLGPGGFQSPNELIEKPGSILIESSTEFRFKLFDLFGQVNGAYFIDAGNIWNFSQGNTFQNGNFDLNQFYKQIAVGTGLGIRWDFTYFLLRLDLATKMIDPSKDTGKKWVLNKTSFGNSENPVLFNIGIGYPF